MRTSSICCCMHHTTHANDLRPSHGPRASGLQCLCHEPPGGAASSKEPERPLATTEPIGCTPTAAFSASDFEVCGTAATRLSSWLRRERSSWMERLRLQHITENATFRVQYSTSVKYEMRWTDGGVKILCYATQSVMRGCVTRRTVEGRNTQFS